ncbi:hypothetical protein AU255_05900 [Methyloprofundus sedimenti]|uniref:Uncharacterized protein n=1 Tax=Methyloprofundus sedimenti TaxID=1420851 RepID=A0A1V8M7A8_9GAMM|nr:hypothetical protein AU255_05900 [Methyloprofundus sedimenti]
MPAINQGQQKSIEAQCCYKADKTIIARPAVEPLTPNDEPLNGAIIIPPIIPAIKLENRKRWKPVRFLWITGWILKKLLHPPAHCISSLRIVYCF